MLGMENYLVQITPKITAKQREYLDKEIKKERWASYSHAVRWLIEDHRRRNRLKKRSLG